MTHSQPHNIVVIGGGVAGVSTAYFLATHPNRDENVKITLVEGTRIAAAASGYSGGFLAKDWHGSATASKCSDSSDAATRCVRVLWSRKVLTGCGRVGLSAMSYDLHAKLAKDFGGEKWGYRTVDTLVSISLSPSHPS